MVRRVLIGVVLLAVLGLVPFLIRDDKHVALSTSSASTSTSTTTVGVAETVTTVPATSTIPPTTEAPARTTTTRRYTAPVTGVTASPTTASGNTKVDCEWSMAVWPDYSQTNPHPKDIIVINVTSPAFANQRFTFTYLWTAPAHGATGDRATADGTGRGNAETNVAVDRSMEGGVLRVTARLFTGSTTQLSCEAPPFTVHYDDTNRPVSYG